jgi:hypothetical protein
MVAGVLANWLTLSPGRHKMRTRMFGQGIFVGKQCCLHRVPKMSMKTRLKNKVHCYK